METAEKHIAVKVHETEKGIVIGACDTDLLGKRLSEGKLVLEVLEEFYFERHTDPEELASLIEGAITANLVGEKTVGAYCAQNPDAEGSVISISGVPHLQIFHL